MTQELTDSTGASVTVTVAPAGLLGAYIVSVDGVHAGRADFIDPPGPEDERIVFHTEVDEQFAGRGLAGLLLGEVLMDITRRNLTLVPVCPLFGRHLKKHGDEFRAGGGMFRLPRPADFAAVTRAGS
ncbi:N-acetyltransferase [Arthrobacter sp. zg-Y916]|uniref:GNAT family N-acetyltransferase n=1 Tax=Arthrobacter sp. zg-Y916 TaxID=2894190 RepID=UPI001E49F445|nr:N-acetyltransferase [Arthrobacter sp. zg-Y916]MCC9193094.1 N-acetyltransferase [Arthrobacter sp. zg-Y916]